MNREHIVIARRYDEEAIKANPELATEFVKGHYINGHWLSISDEYLEERDKYSYSSLRYMKKSELINLACEYHWDANDGNITKNDIIEYILASKLRILISGTIRYASEFDYTISYRSLKDIISRGDPSQLDVPSTHVNSCMELYLPLVDEMSSKKIWAHAYYNPHYNQPYWTYYDLGYRLYSRPGTNHWLVSKNIGHGHRGNLDVLTVHLKNAITDYDCEEIEDSNNHREIWVRHDWTARDLFPDEFRADEDVIVNLADHNKMEMDNGEKTGR